MQVTSMWKRSDARVKITNKTWSSPSPPLSFFRQHEMNMKNESAVREGIECLQEYIKTRMSKA